MAAHRPLALVVLAWLAAPVAGAADPALASDLKAAADAAFAEKQYTKALHLLHRAWAAQPSPGLIANQGIVLKTMGEYARAVEKFEAFIRLSDDPGQLELAEVEVRRMKPEVLVVSEPPGAVVRFDNEPKAVGATPVRSRLLVGTHVVWLEAAGYQRAQLSFGVELGEPRTVSIQLEPARPVVDSAAADLEPRSRVLPYASFGTGAAAAVAAALFALSAKQEAGARDEATTHAAWREHDDAAHSRATGVYVAGGLMVSAIAAGALLLLLEGD